MKKFIMFSVFALAAAALIFSRRDNEEYDWEQGGYVKFPE